MATPAASRRTLQETVAALQTLCKTEKGSVLSEETRSLVVKLKRSLLRHATSSHAFNASGGPQLLLQLLSQCACSVQDAGLLLGVLANICALDKNCRDSVMREHSLIVGFLRSDDFAVLNTAARLTANICLDVGHIPSLLTTDVVGLLIPALSRENTDCKRSVLRTLRLLAANDKCRAEIVSRGGLDAVIDCLQCSNEQAIVAAMQTVQALILDSFTAPLCTKSTLQVVVNYCSHTKESVREIALKLLLSASKCSEGRAALSSSGGVEALVQLMEQAGELLCEVVTALCICCRDVTSRQHLRDCGGLKTLTSLLRDDSQAGLHMSIMSALICYYFDETTLKSMVVSMDLLPTLVHHLDKGPLVTTSQGDAAISLEELPPYLPITPPPAKKPLLTVDAAPDLLDSLLCSPSCVVEQPRVQPLPASQHYQVVLLLSRVSHLKSCLPLLSQPPTLRALLSAFLSGHTHQLHLYKILTRVFTSPHCFEHSLQCYAPSILLQQGQLDHSQELLERLRKVGNSPYGQGVLTHMLLRGEHQHCSALAVPILCKSLRVCKRLMLDHGGYQQLCSLLTSSENELQTMVLDSLCLLVSGLPHFANYIPPLTQPPPSGYCRYMDSDLCPFDLTLIVLTNRIPVHRHVMSQASDVFRALLNGQYKEGRDIEVTLCDTHPTAFTALVHHVYGCSWECPQADSPHGCSWECPQADSPHGCSPQADSPHGCSWECPQADSPHGCSWECPQADSPHGCSWECPQADNPHRCSPQADSPQADSPHQSNVHIDTTQQLITSIASQSPVPVATARCLGVMVIAGQYLVDELTTLCQHAAVKYILPSNVVEMFYLSRMHQCHCLTESCLRVVMAMGEIRRDVLRDLLTSYVSNDVLNMFKMFITIS